MSGGPMTPEELHKLWVEAGCPVIEGMWGTRGIVLSHECSHVTVFSESFGVLSLAVEHGEWSPNFAHPTTEPLLMHLAEVAVGYRMEWVCDYAPDDARTELWLSCSTLVIDPYVTRTELALRIIIAARAKAT